MPVFNAADHLRPAIDSILGQTFTDFEFLIIDNCSTDSTVNIVTSYDDDRIRFLQNEQNIGSLGSRNRALKNVRGAYFVFQDSDDISDPDRFQKQLNLLRDNPEIFLCGCFYKAIDDDGQFLKDVRLPIDPIALRNEFKERCPILFPTTMAKKEVYESIGGFREYFNDKANYDYDWLTMAAENFQVSAVPEFLYKRRILSSSNSKVVTNTDKLFGDQIVRFLQQQRASTGKDALMGEGAQEFENFIEERRKYVNSRPQYYYHWQMDVFMSYGMYKDALKNAVKAIQANPYILKSYRDVFYILRKLLLRNLGRAK